MGILVFIVYYKMDNTPWYFRHYSIVLLKISSKAFDFIIATRKCVLNGKYSILKYGLLE